MPSWDGGDMAWHLLTSFLRVGAIGTLLEQWGLALLSACSFSKCSFIHTLTGQWVLTWQLLMALLKAGIIHAFLQQ